MAVKMTKRGSMDNEVTFEFFCDTTNDLQDIDPKYITLGSIAIVIDGPEIYIANSNKEWVNFG